MQKDSLNKVLGAVLVILAGLYGWFWSIFISMEPTLGCIVDGISEGFDMGGNVTAAMEELPPLAITALEEARPLFLTLTAVPNGLTWITLFVYVLSKYCTCFGGENAPGKILYSFTLVIMFVGMASLVAVGVQGARFATGRIPEVDLICSDYLEETKDVWMTVNDEMEIKKTRLENLGWESPVNETLKAELQDEVSAFLKEAEEPLEQYTHLQRTCDCGSTLIPIIAYSVAPCFVIVVVYIATLGILCVHRRATGPAQDVTIKSGQAEMVTSTTASEAKAEGV
jgi:hypothetical protein